MLWWTDLDQAYDDVHSARAAVDKAYGEYSRGKGVDGLNKANTRLADAHSRLREITGGRVRDTR